MKSFCDQVTGYGKQFPHKVHAKPIQIENVEQGDKSNINQDDSKIGLLNEVWHEFSRYCENSTIHGVKYLGRKNVHWSERIWWIASFAIAAVICISCINKMYLKITPTTITFDDNYTPISEIPFPTVTICNPFTVDTAVLNYSGINQQILDSNYTISLRREVIQRMYSASLFCLNGTTIRDYINRNNKTIDRNIWPYLKQISPGIGMRECKLSRKRIYCPDLFTKVLTFYGTCYTFNHLSSEEVYYEKELADDFPKFKRKLIEKSNSTWPHKKFTNFHDNPDIIFDLQIFPTNNDPSCNLYPRDLLLFIHPAEDQDASKEISVPLDHISRVNLRPNKITTDHNLIKALSKEERKCVNINDATETNLTFFRKYSQKNCYYEKFVRRLISDCGCAFFWMPRWNETKLCNWELNRDCWSSENQSFVHGSSRLPSSL
ncbi:hypothetical protein HA402_004574 [Bradysia odoriphaga]|nr:hypothetical protein HA402_004574 [Bradysia odoriphaga]